MARIWAAATKAIDGDLPLGLLRGPSAKFWCSGPYLGRVMYRARATSRPIFGLMMPAHGPKLRKHRTLSTQRVQGTHFLKAQRV